MQTTRHAVPPFTATDAIRLAAARYDLVAEARRLPGEHDANFLLTSACGVYVLKIAHAGEDAAVLDLQHALLAQLAERAPQLALPRVVRDCDGQLVGQLADGAGRGYAVRVLSYVPGILLAQSAPHDPDLLHSLGHVLGTLDAALADFTHPAAVRVLKWDLCAAGWIGDHLDAIVDPLRRAIVARGLAGFRAIAPHLALLPRSIIHNDANDYNVIVDRVAGQRRVVGLIDFGDCLVSATICELAIGIAYAILGKPDPLSAALPVIAGYHAARPLHEDELAVLLPLVVVRLGTSVVNSALLHAANPADAYLTVSEAAAWDALTILDATPAGLAHALFRGACDLPPIAHAPAVVAWLAQYAAQIAPILKQPLTAANTTVLDLSIGSPDLGNWPAFADDDAFERRVTAILAERGRPIGAGGYLEVRPIYTTPAFMVAGNDGPQWRTVHLGVDLWAPPGTVIHAPLAGVVHSFADNDAPRDYGPTIVLTHTAEPGLTFYSLYGHLSRESLAGLRVGQGFAAGEIIGTIGGRAVNGGWPPHVHIQIITDLLGSSGDFPGVARPSQRAVWQSVSPDANLLVAIPPDLFPPADPDQSTILAERRTSLGHNLSVAYQRPLTIVRGFMQHLYADDGRAYLDAVNNVPHVGHQHPHVVRAAQRQMALLNTNTRYLHAGLARYAARLAATLPDPLSVVYLVCSGSEATELAIRLARAATGQRDLIISDGAYHGNTTTLIDISPYKAEGAGGCGLAPWAHKAPMPDVYRGAFGAGDPDAGRKYAQQIAPIIARVQAEGRGISGFMIESLLSCGGQIVLPPGYLHEVYALVRAAGGVCIADEVQVGFGRVGTHFWGFETQGVVPDIVALGKPIGNGHPLGAVVTTPAIAAAFDNGMEYFNTFGGNMVSVAIGDAVLDVLEREGLQQRANDVGALLLAGLRSLAAHPLVGDVRGQGLMIGVELVTDHATRAPAADQASYIANRLRDNGILLSTDGPLHNVLKIKPPLVFNEADADRLVMTLDRVLREDDARA